MKRRNPQKFSNFHEKKQKCAFCSAKITIFSLKKLRKRCLPTPLTSYHHIYALFQTFREKNFFIKNRQINRHFLRKKNWFFKKYRFCIIPKMSIYLLIFDFFAEKMGYILIDRQAVNLSIPHVLGEIIRLHLQKFIWILPILHFDDISKILMENKQKYHICLKKELDILSHFSMEQP